jgi:hypothetical protein
MYVDIQTGTHAQVYMYTCMHVYTHLTHICLHTYRDIGIHTFTFIHAQVHTSMNTHTHTQVHTLIHTHRALTTLFVLWPCILSGIPEGTWGLQEAVSWTSMCVRAWSHVCRTVTQ